MRRFAPHTILAVPRPLLPFEKPNPINRAYFWLHCSSQQPAGPGSLPSSAARHRTLLHVHMRCVLSGDRAGGRCHVPVLLAAVFSHLSHPPCPHWAHSALATWCWNVPFPTCCPGETGRHGIIEYISPESIQALALYEQSLLTELIFAK